MIIPERLLPGVKRTFHNKYLEMKIPIVLGELWVSAFLNSGRSDHGYSQILRVRFRPQAVIRVETENPVRKGIHCDPELHSQLPYRLIQPSHFRLIQIFNSNLHKTVTVAKDSADVKISSNKWKTPQNPAGIRLTKDKLLWHLFLCGSVRIAPAVLVYI